MEYHFCTEKDALHDSKFLAYYLTVLVNGEKGTWHSSRTTRYGD